MTHSMNGYMGYETI